MTLKKFIRLSSFDLMAAGALTALFWLTAIPFETFAGAEVVRHPLYMPGQLLHTLASLFMVFGYTGLYLRHLEQTGWLGLLGYAISVLGAVFFFGDAVIAIAAFPALADSAPELLSATGPFFTGWVLTLYIIFFATHTVGVVIFGIALWLANLMARPAVALFIVGGILFNLPAAPALHIPHVVGGVIYGIGLVWMGLQMLGEGTSPG